MADRTFLDWPFLDATHRALAAELESWCAANLGHGHGEDIDAECRALVRKLGEGGWLRYCVPAAYGGVHERLDVRSLALIRETLARHDGLADFVFAMQGLGSGTISLFGNEAQKQAYLPAVASGETIAAFALTEPTSGSDVASMETRAEPDGDGYVVNGSKTYISNGGIADFYVLFARTGEAPGAKGVSAFIVESGIEGLDDIERIEVIAPHVATLKSRNCPLRRPSRRARPGFAQAIYHRWFGTRRRSGVGLRTPALDEATARAYPANQWARHSPTMHCQSIREGSRRRILGPALYAPPGCRE